VIDAASRRRIWAVARRQFYVMRRALPRWFDLSVWPMLDVVVWGSLGAFVAQENDTSRAATPFLLAGIVLFHVLFQTQIAVSTGFMEETWTRNLLNVMTTPVREVEYALGLAIYALAKLAMGMATVCLAAWLFFGFDTSSIGWSLVPICAVLMLCGWALAQVAIGLLLRFGPSAEIMTWGLIFLTMALSGVFNPVDTIPGPLRPIARLAPTSAAFEAMRTVLAGGSVPWGDLGVALIGAVVAAGLGLLFVVRMLKVFRDRGFVTRFS
jgi:ABC-2 type transport system permease protein